ncbi:vesicle transporter SEC22 [Pseudogymnoascus sp. 05NY08]|nr:vesicle transporter SEC22 [Pseudogymnoascus sp. 05NY08]
MIKSTQIARLDGLMLCASIDDEATENALTEIKSHVKMVLRRLNRNSEPQASIESGAYTLHYLIANSIVYIAICERSYPRKLAFTYLSDLSSEFSSTYTQSQLTAPSLRPYAFMEFDTFIQRTKATYSDTRATQNLDKLNSELQDVTKVMTKNIEDLLYRGDSLERMGEMSSRLRDDSKKYKRAANMKFQVAAVFFLAPLALAGLGGKNNGNPPHTTIHVTEPINSAIAGIGAILGAIPAIPVPEAPAAPAPV